MATLTAAGTTEQEEAQSARREAIRPAQGANRVGGCRREPEDRGGLRYCINSAALRFIHRDDMEDEGYAAYLNQVDDVR